MEDRRWTRRTKLGDSEEYSLDVEDETLLACWELGGWYMLTLEGFKNLDRDIHYNVGEGLESGSDISGLGKYVNLLLDVPGIPDDAKVGFEHLVEEVQKQLAMQ